MRAGAGDRFAELELNALVQVFSITDDRDAELREITDRWPTLSVDDASVIPYLMIGSIDEIVGHVHACRDRWGITYFVVRALDERRSSTPSADPSITPWFGGSPTA